MPVIDPTPLPLVGPIGARYESLTQDSRLVNCFAEKDQTGRGFFVYKRPGFLSQSTAISAGTGRGIFNWVDHIYAVVGNTVYKDGAALTGTVDTTTEYYFTAGLGATPKLMLANTVAGYYVNLTGTLTQITDTNFPPNQTPAVPIVGGVEYLDATFYCMDGNANIYASYPVGNDPSNWTPANTIVAQIESMPAIYLGMQLVYILACKEFYTEAFYDAGNAAGSPLGEVQGAKMNYGCALARSVQDVGGDLVWLGATREGTLCVVQVANAQAKVVSTPAIDRVLESFNLTGGGSTTWSWSAKEGGHRFYGLTNTVANITLVYDLSVGLWYQWTDPNGNYLPYVGSTSMKINGTGKSVFLHATSGATFNLDIRTYGDNGVPFPVDIYTPNYTGGSLRQKTLGRMDIVGDMVTGSTLNVSWSDDDYQTFSSPIALDLGLPRPQVSGLGAFNRRAFHFNHLGNYPFRIEQVDLWLDQGT
jgi:hypothetical protein